MKFNGLNWKGTKKFFFSLLLLTTTILSSISLTPQSNVNAGMTKEMDKIEIKIESITITDELAKPRWNTYYALKFAPYYMRLFFTSAYYGPLQTTNAEYDDLGAVIERYPDDIQGLQKTTYTTDLTLEWSYCLGLQETTTNEIFIRFLLYQQNPNSYCYIDYYFGSGSVSYDTTYSTPELVWAAYGGKMIIDFRICHIS